MDPSFLAALPEHIRQEVVAEQNRLERIRRRAAEQAQVQAQAQAQQSSQSETSSSSMEVNPEFLAALPPAIQEEVNNLQQFTQLFYVPTNLSESLVYDVTYVLIFVCQRHELRPNSRLGKTFFLLAICIFAF